MPAWSDISQPLRADPGLHSRAVLTRPARLLTDDVGCSFYSYFGVTETNVIAFYFETKYSFFFSGPVLEIKLNL
jgi:hypothetical protein